MMQINVVFEPPTIHKPQSPHGSFDDDDEDKQSGGESDNEDKKQESKLTEDQIFMKNILEQKKIMVVKELIKKLSHRNRDDTEGSLNARTCLIELIEIEKTFEIFFLNDADLINQIVELAADPSNKFNQQYLLQVLLSITKQLKPSNQNIFKDLDEDEQYGKQGG